MSFVIFGIIILLHVRSTVWAVTRLCSDKTRPLLGNFGDIGLQGGILDLMNAYLCLHYTVTKGHIQSPRNYSDIYV